ncbi:MAG: energy transducer TonB [Deltaproteobacteria bacterium]|nr:energy transducer TonB [Deltaproteobacteria bacterium]
MNGETLATAPGSTGHDGGRTLFWSGILVSVAFHGVLLSLPLTVGLPRETVCEKLALVIESTEAAKETPLPANPIIPGEIDRQDSSQAAAETQQETASPPIHPMDTQETTPAMEPEEVNVPRSVEEVRGRPPIVREIAERPVPRPEKKRKAAPVTRARNEPPPRETPRSHQSDLDAIATAEERHESASVANPMGSGSTPPAVAGGTTHQPVDTPFGSRYGPRFLMKVLPRYPRLARELGKEGTVLLQLLLDEKGKLLDVQILKKAGSGFDEEAVRAVKNSTFSPATRNGRPIMCRARLPIQFVLRDSSDD